jgi:hypothetical protein
MKFDCEDCGLIEIAIIDGYSFGDRLLDGVIFEVCKSDEGEFTVEVAARCAPYFNTLNTEMWLEEAREYAAETDNLCCPTCGREVLPEDEL